MAEPDPNPPFPEDQPGVPGPEIEVPEPTQTPNAPDVGDPFNGRPHDGAVTPIAPPAD